MLCLTAMLCGCHQDNDEYMTIAVIRLESNEIQSIERVQAMAHFTNLNTRHITSTSNSNGPEVQVELLRGAYQVLIEGTISYTDRSGARKIGSFRAISDYVELTATEGRSAAKLNIILLE